MGRAVSINELYNKKRKLLNFAGEWLESFGKPELKGTIFIHGNSGNGKTTFVAMLFKYLSNFGRGAYNSLEEGDSESLKLAFKKVGMQDVKSKVILLDKENMTDLKERLRKHKAPKIVVIDSIQYTRMKTTDWLDMVAEFNNTLFVVVSQSTGKKPKGTLADDIYYDASIKIWVEGYVAFVKSRYGGSKPYVIWKEGAEKYWGSEILLNN
jgi:hypothetical protein